MKITKAVSLFPLVLLGGCLLVPNAKAPKKGAVATGEPVAVIDDLKVWTTRHKEKVGEAVHTDADGRTVGKTNVYAERTKVHTKKVWYMVQGRQRIDDEDFFRITGNARALDDTQQMRAKARKWNRRGKITMAVGAIGSIAAIFVGNPLGRTLLGLGGSAALGAGWYMSFWSAKKMAPESHAVHRSIAERDAFNYNQRLGSRTKNAPKVQLNVTRSF